MKLLTIGLDGGDQRIINHMPMPFLQSLLKDNRAPELTGDLFSRGWSEIFTGKHALETGAFYMRPRLDGTHSCTDSYNYKRALEAGVDPLWRRLNQAGARVGIMNIPTTSPAEPVEGFLVGGAGGGLHKVDGVPDAMCDTPETHRFLEANGYIPDMRVGSAALQSIFELFDRLDEIAKVRADCFLSLCEKHEPDFGFLCYRVTATVQYFALTEIEAIIAAVETAEGDLRPGEYPPGLNEIQKRILGYFRVLDGILERVFETLKPEQYVLCADHGMASYKFKANANAFLEEAGYLVLHSAGSMPLRSFLTKAWRLLRKKLVGKRKSPGYVRNPKLRAAFAAMPFDPRRTRAFGNFYVSGMFINDRDRFGGPVGEDEIDEVVDAICAEFNRHETSKKHGMIARPFRREHQDSRWERELPDIHIDKPDEIFFAGKGGFVSVNENYGPLSEGMEGLTDMNTGQKSRHPLFAISEGLTGYIRGDDARDLCLVCKVIERYFGSTPQ